MQPLERVGGAPAASGSAGGPPLLSAAPPQLAVDLQALLQRQAARQPLDGSQHQEAATNAGLLSPLLLVGAARQPQALVLQQQPLMMIPTSQAAGQQYQAAAAAAAAAPGVAAPQPEAAAAGEQQQEALPPSLDKYGGPPFATPELAQAGAELLKEYCSAFGTGSGARFTKKEHLPILVRIWDHVQSVDLARVTAPASLPTLPLAAYKPGGGGTWQQFLLQPPLPKTKTGGGGAAGRSCAVALHLSGQGLQFIRRNFGSYASAKPIPLGDGRRWLLHLRQSLDGPLAGWAFRLWVCAEAADEAAAEAVLLPGAAAASAAAAAAAAPVPDCLLDPDDDDLVDWLEAALPHAEELLPPLLQLPPQEQQPLQQGFHASHALTRVESFGGIMLRLDTSVGWCVLQGKAPLDGASRKRPRPSSNLLAAAADDEVVAGPPPAEAAAAAAAVPTGSIAAALAAAQQAASMAEQAAAAAQQAAVLLQAAVARLQL